ncbi:hypothetical protein P5673_000322 [Acropora cervicornis]|uniref:Uncharacterized protein n=1 Tax=Acropora cervicornis TaxID=6130 RepID=A0AAD9VHN0_ACRCE|nr:hypothetical protein P5673_000322 [Acropora cervicornis]
MLIISAKAKLLIKECAMGLGPIFLHTARQTTQFPTKANAAITLNTTMRTIRNSSGSGTRENELLLVTFVD